MPTSNPQPESAPPLQIHVFGAGKGESIAIGLPDGRWGLVDCYSSNTFQAEKHPIIKFLKGRRVSTLEFVCLTHPHDDHYRGMSLILKEFSVREFWRFNAFDNRAVAPKIAADWKLHYPPGAPDDESEARTSLNELEEIFTILSQRGKRTSQNYIRIVRAELGQTLMDKPGDGRNPRFKVVAIAPEAEINERYIEQAQAGSSQLRHNDVSLALVIDYGQQRVVLGGDVEESSWDRIYDLRDDGFNVPIDVRNATLIKVCHHGSHNSRCVRWWDELAPNANVCAVVTPYTRFNLPQSETIEFLRKRVDRLFVTNQHAVGLHGGRVNLMPDSKNNPRALKAKAMQRIMKSLVPTSQPTNCCSFTLNPHVRTVEVECGTDAYEFYE